MSDTQNSHICRRILREVKKSGEIYIVLDCDVGHVTTVLREAKEVGMMTAYHNFLITSLDLHLIDMEEFKYGGTNITALRLVDPHRPAVQVDKLSYKLSQLLYTPERVVKPPLNLPETTLNLSDRPIRAAAATAQVFS